MKKLALTLSLALATTAFAAPMFAKSGEAKQVTVKFADLNLENEAGVEALYGRIRGAARNVCKDAQGRSAAQHLQWTSCMSQAMDGAVASVGSDALSSLHIAKTSSTSGSVAKK